MSLQEASVHTPERTGARPRRTKRTGGPRTPAGKRRSRLNSLKRGLCPPWVERDLRTRGEDPQRFIRLHRELMGWLWPDDARTRVIVETLAETWWEKMRRIRNWVGAGAPDTAEIDQRINDLLQRLVVAAQILSRKWRYRLESTVRVRLYGPDMLRRVLEVRLPSLGGKRRTRKRRTWRAQRNGSPDPRREKIDETIRELADMMAFVRHLKKKAGGRMAVPATGPGAATGA